MLCLQVALLLPVLGIIDPSHLVHCLDLAPLRMLLLLNQQVLGFLMGFGSEVGDTHFIL